MCGGKVGDALDWAGEKAKDVGQAVIDTSLNITTLGHADEVKRGIDRAWNSITGEADRELAKEQMGQAEEAQAKQDDILAAMLAYARERDAEQMGLAKEQFNWQRGLAEEADRRRQETVQKMLEDAEIMPEEVSRQVGRSAADVSSSYDKALASQRRGLTRMGIDPSSGRYVSSDRLASLDKARAIAGAKGLTRQTLKDRSDALKHGARMVNVGLTPLGLGVNDRRIGMGSSTLGAMSQGAGAYGQRGLTYAGFGNNNYMSGNNALRGLVSDIAGAGTTAYLLSSGGM